MKQVYLAGPSVFRPDARAEAAHQQALCRAAGFEGLAPIDKELTAPDAGTLVHQIYEGNRILMDTADGMIAEMTTFRGAYMDVGTAYEMGYAAARGIPLVGWCEDARDYVEKLGAQGYVITADADGIPRDQNNMQAEDFGIIDNVMMVAGADIICERFEHAVAAMARLLNIGPPGI